VPGRWLRQNLDPHDAKGQARGYAGIVKAPVVILSNGPEHWHSNPRQWKAT
jgi:hypothetical protein